MADDNDNNERRFKKWTVNRSEENGKLTRFDMHLYPGEGRTQHTLLVTQRGDGNGKQPHECRERIKDWLEIKQGVNTDAKNLTYLERRIDNTFHQVWKSPNGEGYVSQEVSREYVQAAIGRHNKLEPLIKPDNRPETQEQMKQGHVVDAQWKKDTWRDVSKDFADGRFEKEQWGPGMKNPYEQVKTPQNVFAQDNAHQKKAEAQQDKQGPKDQQKEQPHQEQRHEQKRRHSM